MTELPQDFTPETQPEPTIAEIALRSGTPEEWGRPERNYQVADRICEALGLDRITDEIREAGIVESDRQEELHTEWQRSLRRLEEKEKLRSRMGGTATKLVDALVPQDDPRDREAIIENVLEALRPIDERLTHAEWDGVIGH